ncbi:hypothetical protein FQZ97_926500 [compost metagenome]
MAVERVVTRVAFSTFEPAAVHTFIACENLIPWLEPVDGSGCFSPEAFRVILPCGVGFGIFRCHAVPPRSTRSIGPDDPPKRRDNVLDESARQANLTLSPPRAFHLLRWLVYADD